MIGSFETSIPIEVQSNFKKAETAAVQEAIVTGSLVLTVKSIEIGPNFVRFAGTVPRHLFFSRLTAQINTNATYIKLSLKKFSKFYTIWSKITEPTSPLGFLTFSISAPILLQHVFSNDSFVDDAERIVICSQFKRIGETLSQKIFGLALCGNCGQEINKERLKALPGVSYCYYCAKVIEEGRKRT